jgi:hypothetical protein
LRPWHVGVAATTVGLIGLVAVRIDDGGRPSIVAASLGQKHGAAAVVAPTTTSTTAAASPRIELSQVGATPDELALAVPGPTVPIGIATTRHCWVEVRNGDSHGPVVFSEMIDGTHPLAVSVANPAWIRLGNPQGVSLTVATTSFGVPGDRPVDITISPTPVPGTTTS